MFCRFMMAAVGGALAVIAPAQDFTDLERALRDHPSLLVMDHQAQASREMADAALGLPDPVLSAGLNNFPIFDPSFNEFLPTNKAIGIGQTFPSRAGRDARAAEARAQADEFRALREQRYAALRGELIALLHEKRRIARQTEIANQRRQRYDDLTNVAESQIDAGRPAVARLADIDGERAEVARALIGLAGQSSAIDARLIDLVGQVPTTSPPVLAEREWSGDEQAFHATSVAAAALRIRDRGVEQAKAAWKPEWGAEVSYQQRQAGNDFAGDDWVSASVTVTVPFWARRNQAPRLRAAKAQRAAARAQYAAAVRAAAAQYAVYEASRVAAQQSKAVIAQKMAAIRDQMAAQLTVYESGAGDYAPIIDGEIAILDLRSQIAGHDARIATATARMNAMLVTP